MTFNIFTTGGTQADEYCVSGSCNSNYPSVSDVHHIYIYKNTVYVCGYLWEEEGGRSNLAMHVSFQLQ